MISSIMKHEWRLLSADRAVWIAIALITITMAYGLRNGAAWQDTRQRTIDTVLEEEAGRLAEWKQKFIDYEQGGNEGNPPVSAPAFGSRTGARYVALPPGPLSALAIGQSDLYPAYLKVTTAGRNSILNHEEPENPTHLLTGRFDLAFVVIVLFPLLILAMSYNLLSGEREQGTLALLLAQPVSLKTVLMGKIGLRALVVVGTAMMLTILGALAGGVGFNLLLVLWLVVVMAYGLFWFGVAVLINAFGRPSSTNALALAGIWLLAVVVIPTLLNILVTTLYPIPSRVELVTAIRSATEEANKAGNQLLARYYEDHPELVSEGERDMDDFWSRRVAVQENVERDIEPLLTRYDEQLVNQQAMVNRWRFVSPAVAAQEALNTIAGVGIDRYRHFLMQVEAYHEIWQDFFFQRIFRKAALTSAEIENLPAFTFQEESVGVTARRGLGAILEILIPALLIAALALYRLRSYSIV